MLGRALLFCATVLAMIMMRPVEASRFEPVTTAQYLAWTNALPVYSGSGAAPVATGQPFNNGGIVMIAR